MNRRLDDLLKDIRGLAAAGRYRITRHAYVRMDERGCAPKDVRNALVHAKECSPARETCWCVIGPDQDGDDLKLIVVIEEDILVVTLY